MRDFKRDGALPQNLVITLDDVGDAVHAERQGIVEYVRREAARMERAHELYASETLRWLADDIEAAKHLEAGE